MHTDAPTDAPAERRVVLLQNGSAYVGPALARVLAARGQDLVIGDPAPGLVDELAAHGIEALGVDGVGDAAREGAVDGLVAAALERFGRLDAACWFGGRIVTGTLVDSEVEDLRTVLRGCVEAPYRFLQAVLPPMVAAGGGQVLVMNSAAGARPTKGAPLYSSARAAGIHLVRNAAAEVARHGVQVNSVGTNFMDFPDFRAAAGADDPEVRAAIEAAVPMRRLGTMEEFAHFSAVFLDGGSGFTTGQFVAYAGGWV